MTWWLLLIPAIAVLIQSLPYLIGGGLAAYTILTNPTAIVSIIAGAAGAYLIYNNKPKEGIIAIVIGGVLFLIPQIATMFQAFLGWSAALFSNVFFMLVILGGVMAYFLASQKKLTGKYAVYLILSIVGASVFYLLLNQFSVAGGGVGITPAPNWYEVTLKIDFTTWQAKAKATSISVVDYSLVNYCVEEVQPLFVLPTERNYVLKVLDSTGRLVMQKTLKAEWGWFQVTTSDLVKICLRSGSYKIIAYATDTPESKVETRIILQ